jgi:hypothetical protein
MPAFQYDGKRAGDRLVARKGGGRDEWQRGEAVNRDIPP